MPGFVRACCFAAMAALVFAPAAPRGTARAEATLVAPTVIVIGFVGGFVGHNDSVHSVVQVAAHLRQDYPSGVYVQVFENHHGEAARLQILHLLDADHDGTLTGQEKQNARIILYGHSWGASEAVTVARELKRDGIPVLLTIQVDSIRKKGENDTLIPANVAEAVNFYQPDGLLHGEPAIGAANPERTQILGNFRFDYKGSSVQCREYPWYDRIFMKYHTEIECDPRVWNRVESLIRSKLLSPATAQDTSQ